MDRKIVNDMDLYFVMYTKEMLIQMKKTLFGNCIITGVGSLQKNMECDRWIQIEFEQRWHESDLLDQLYQDEKQTPKPEFFKNYTYRVKMYAHTSGYKVEWWIFI